MPMLCIELLGDLTLTYGDQRVTFFNSARLQSFLAFLLLHAGAPQQRQHLAFLFWPDSTEAQARTNLRNLIHQLRSTLPAADQFLEIDSQSVMWRAEAPFTLDVSEFRRSIDEAHRAKQAGRRAEARDALERAVDLYRGSLLPSCYDDWILSERDHLDQMFLIDKCNKSHRITASAYASFV